MSIRPIRLGGPASSSAPDNFSTSAVGTSNYFAPTNNNIIGEYGRRNTINNNRPTFIDDQQQQQQQQQENDDPNVSFDFNNNNNNDLSLVVRRGGGGNNNIPPTTIGTSSRNGRNNNNNNNRGSGRGKRTSSGGNNNNNGRRRRPTFDDDNNDYNNNNNNNDPVGFGIDPSRRLQQPQFQSVGELAPRNGFNGNRNQQFQQQQQQGSYYTGDRAASLYYDPQQQPQQYQPPQQLQSLPTNNFEQQQQQQQQPLTTGLSSPTGNNFNTINNPRSPRRSNNNNNNNNNNNSSSRHPSAKVAALEREIVRLRYALIIAHKKLQANKIDIPKQNEMNVPHVKGLPLQPLAKANHVGVARLFEGYLEVLEGVDIAVPVENATSSIFGGPEWKRRYVVVNEGGVSVYKSEEDVRKYAGQRGLKGSLMFQFVSAFVPAFGPAGRDLSKWEPPHPLATDTEHYRYFGFVRDAGTLMLFRTQQLTEWHTWSHALGRAINPTLYAQTFPDIVAADPDPKIDDLTKLSDEEKKKYEEIAKAKRESGGGDGDLDDDGGDDRNHQNRKNNNNNNNNNGDQMEEDPSAWLNDDVKRKKKLEVAIAVITAAADHQNSDDMNMMRMANQPRSPIKLTADNLSIDAKLKAKLQALLSPTHANASQQQQQQQPSLSSPIAAPPSHPPPPPPPPPPSVDTSDRGNDPIFPTPKMVAVGVQIETKEVDTRISGMQTDAWLPDQSIVDPVEVENQWASHVEELHLKYGEHTSKLEHNLQLARAEVAQLSSTLELLRNTTTANNNTTSSATTGVQPVGMVMMSTHNNNRYTNNNNEVLVGDEDEEMYSSKQNQVNNNVAAGVHSFSPSASSSITNGPVVGGTRRMQQSGTRDCQNCQRLEEVLISVEEERDSLVRVLAQRHEDYTKGISRLCDQVLDDIDAVHAHMRDQQITLNGNNNASRKMRRNRGMKNNDDDDDDDDDDDEYYDDDDDDMAEGRNDSSSSILNEQEHKILLQQMQEIGKIIPPFISLQLFDESPVTTTSTMSQQQQKSRNQQHIGKVGVRAAFDSRVCVIDSVTPGRDTCTWTAKDSKTGKNLCSVKLKLENGASLFVQHHHH